MKRTVQAAVAALMIASSALVGPAFAAENAASSATGTFEAPAADWLFVQNAQAVTFDGHTMTLQGVTPQTVMFTDRPQRMSGDISTTAFTKTWTEGKDNFQKDPPNATLSVVVDGKEQTAVVELSNPRLAGNDLTYDVRVLNGDVPQKGGSATLFIDWWYGRYGGVCHYGPWGGVRCFHPW